MSSLVMSELAPNQVNLAPLQRVLARYGPQGRAGLLPALLEAQSIYGHIPQDVAAAIGRALDVPQADIHGVIDFYALLYREPVGRTVLRVCTDPSCALRGGEQVLSAACRLAGVEEGDTAADGSVTVERSPCLGHC